ncbi:hypothetical protein [Mesobacillus subterraneus]|uniref:Uncharacterized protein n=1 Tax=Mesobacillus subterraneus TaxID=285983 RepID=A0A427TW31_9BACI|nr:hypothetical protein [Mesobacillus subterraneus]RSD28673.1 hypothetical protein EJA10_03605 [Mesobacillus subterraneus]
MTLGLFLVGIVVVAALVATLLLAGRGEKEYSESTRRNTVNLSLIYIVVIVLSFVAVGIYIRWFA